jgi:hypothetical protein
MDPACIGRKVNINMITFENIEFSNKKSRKYGKLYIDNKDVVLYNSFKYR